MIFDSGDSNSSNVDKIVFGQGISQSDLNAFRSANDFVIEVISSGERITLSSYFESQVNEIEQIEFFDGSSICLLYTSPSPRDQRGSRMPSSA